MPKKYKDIIVLLLSLIAIFQIYIYTTFPAFKNDDSPETITSAYTLGISHPPGYPFFTMAAKIFSLLPVGSPAFRINLFAIFLAILVLLLFYYLSKQITFQIFHYENKNINFLSIFILAFSYIYWNQAIEAKGGIYILNLLFLSVLIFLSLRLSNAFDIKNLYLIIYVFGLSLTNHWPSMAIFLPFLAFIFYKYRRKLTGKNFAECLLLLLLGLSTYIYLPIRAENENIFVFMDRPDNLKDLFWTIFLSGYSHGGFPSVFVKGYHIKEIIGLFFTNFNLFGIFGVIGFYALRKVKKEISFLYLSIFLVNLFIVIFSLRLGEKFEWATGTFLMPSLYILAIFSINGIYLISGIFIKKVYKGILFVFLIIILLYTGFLQFKTNNNRYNFIAYDFGDNILDTIKPGSFYMAYGDYFIMPITYLRWVEHRARDIKYASIYSLQYMWGIKDFNRKYGDLNMDAQSSANNLINIIRKFSGNNDFYLSNFEEFLKSNFSHETYGLLYKINSRNENTTDEIYKIYSCRGIYDTNTDYDKKLVSLYKEKFAEKAYEFFEEKNYTLAIKYFNYALLFPEDSETAHIYYDLSFVYKELNDKDNQIKYLKKTIKTKENYYQAYELLGRIYYNEKLWPMAKDMFEEAMKYGSENKTALQQYIYQLGNIDMPTQLEALFNQAVALLAAGKYLKALDYFDFLLEYGYKANEIYRNIGVYNFKNSNFEEALKYFQKAEDWDKSAGIYADIAQTYYKLGQPGKALNILKEAIQTVGNDPQLVNLYNQIQQAEKAKK